MGYIKRINESTNPVVKVVRGIVITILSILFFVFLIGTSISNSQKENERKPKYEVKVSNAIGSQWYSCDSYKQVNNTYKLYDKKGKLIHEITITDGYLITINANE